MKQLIPNNIIRVIAACCVATLLIAIFWMQSGYYIILRIVVFIGAIMLLISKRENPYGILTFLLIGILFNPIVPIYLYKKFLWIPIDIISACAFLLEIIELKVPAKEKKALKQNKSNYGRDRIYKN